MTIEELYVRIGGDYEAVIERLMKHSLVERFVVKFLDDKSYSNLKTALEEKDFVEAFRAAHTLKGVASNLSLVTLQNAASEVTEQLRNLEGNVDEQLIANLDEVYALVVSGIEEWRELCQN